MKRIFISIFIIFFIFTSWNGFAEEEMVSVPRQLSLILVFKGNLNEEEIILLKESLLIKLAEDDDITLVEPVIDKVLSPSERNEKAKEIGADSWLSAEVTAKKETIEIVYSSYDLLNSVFVIEEKKYEQNRKIRNLNRSFWKDIIIDMAQQYSRITGKLKVKEIIENTSEKREDVEEKGVNVVIEAYPGTRIQGLSENVLIIDDSGIADVELAQLATYKIRASCDGYYPIEKNFYVANDPLKIRLEQKPASRFGFDIYLQQMDYLGAGFLFYISPNRFYIELSATTYILKLFWPVEKENSTEYVAPLLPLFLTTGFYMNPADSIFRYGFNFGLFIRFFADEEEGIIIDPVASWGLKIFGFHAELSSWRKVRFFLEYNILVYFSENPDLLWTATNHGTGAGGLLSATISEGDTSAVDFWDIKIGIRLLF